MAWAGLWGQSWRGRQSTEGRIRLPQGLSIRVRLRQCGDDHGNFLK